MEYKELRQYTKDLSILYAEDDKKISMMMKQILGLLFNQTVFAENGKEALDIYKTQKFDIVLLDIDMPILSGLEAAKEMKSINKQQNILFFTAYNTESNIKKAKELNINGFLTKPFKEKEFTTTVYKLIK